MSSWGPRKSWQDRFCEEIIFNYKMYTVGLIIVMFFAFLNVLEFFAVFLVGFVVGVIYMLSADHMTKKEGV